MSVILCSFDFLYVLIVVLYMLLVLMDADCNMLIHALSSMDPIPPQFVVVLYPL